ncbi:hypothetical protein G6514_009607 [Epicoccum nigrum]|nr:hypothetical protein G6514_009607 [Epicoccum nigrum]
MPATDPPRPWRGLPDELKVKILEYTLETNEAEEDDIINDRRSLFSIHLLEPLLLTSKRMNELALEMWGKIKLMNWVPSINMRMQYINSKFGRHVRNLSLSVSVPDHLVWHDPDLDTESVSVRVYNTGFVDDNGDWYRGECPDGCNERLAVGVKALIEQNKL